MAQADSVLSTPPLNAPKISKERMRQLARQQRQAAAATKRVASLRKKATAEIDRLIEFLDQSDEYVTSELELEDDDDDREDEPSLGSVDRAMDQNHWKGATFVPVYNHDLELDDADTEPLLGSVATHDHLSQDYWAQGNRDDREGDGCADDREEDRADDEPALGWPEHMAQGAGGYGGWEDRELCVPTMTLEAWRRFRAQRAGGYRPNPDGRRDSHGR